jgi:hypothetical protein
MTEPPNGTATAGAALVLEAAGLHKCPPSRVTPSPEGGFIVSWERRLDTYAEIECLNNGDFVVTTEDPDNEMPAINAVRWTEIKDTVGYLRNMLVSNDSMNKYTDCD